MRFHPKFCPRPDCPAHSGSGFEFQRAGLYRRRCDRRQVPRFTCLVCRRGFSAQTFRLDWRLKRPDLLVPLFKNYVSKVTHRQSARILPCSRSTEERHFRLIAAHCEAFHLALLAEVEASGGLGEEFLLDELETYERNRLKQPVTVPVLIERYSGFVLGLSAGAMAPRPSASKLTPQEKARRSESVRVVREVLRMMLAFAREDRELLLDTDEKSSYGKLLRELFGERCHHRQTPSTRRRDMSNPLWPVNHTCARLRDGVSRLVRRSWAAAKKRTCLEKHMAIWTCYRNCIRGRVNRTPRRTPAMALGAQTVQWTPERLLRYRVFRAA